MNLLVINLTCNEFIAMILPDTKIFRWKELFQKVYNLLIPKEEIENKKK